MRHLKTSFVRAQLTAFLFFHLKVSINYFYKAIGVKIPSGIDNYSGKEIEKGGPIRTVRISNVHRCSSVTSRLPTRSADSSDEFTVDRTHQPVFMTSATCGTASSGIRHLPPLIIGN
ncbi:unnamed protein product [Trichogramma brassicae]|uniref:Uncharacterized protein n=1 Tax=Trichogramma brassicae TaxID=86971 RepID=A0A6H5IDL6_9HYME|nr:unnamed protein product [Trichogramma brassicae]